MWSFALILLCLSLFPAPGESCITGFQPQNVTKPSFRTRLQIEDPLFYGENITQFLGLCSHLRAPSLEQMELMSVEQHFAIVDCPHPIPPNDSGSEFNNKRVDFFPRNYVLVELFLLKEAQALFRRQRGAYQAWWRMQFGFILFGVPFLMMIFLVIRGHYRFGTLPGLRTLLKTRHDPTDGIKHDLFQHMRYRTLPGSHPSLRKVKEKDKEMVMWCKYNKSDEDIDPHKISITGANTKFRFLSRTNPRIYLDQEESDIVRKSAFSFDAQSQE